MTGCNTFIPNPLANKQDLRDWESAQVPEVYHSDYFLYMDRLGTMKEQFRPGSLVYRVTRVPNKVGGEDLPLDATEMVVTALNRIGHGVLASPWESSHLIESATLGMPITVAKPDYGLQVAITEYDRQLLNASGDGSVDFVAGGGSSRSEGNIGGGKEREVARIAMDFNPVQYYGQVSVPKVGCTLKSEPLKLTRTRELGFFIYGNGGTFRGRKSISVGKHSSVRALVNLGVLMTVGRQLRLPWWRVMGADVDPVVIELLKDEFTSLSEDALIRQVQSLLTLNGFKVQATGHVDDVTRWSVVEYLKKYNLPNDGKINANLYVNLHLTAPMPFDQAANVGPLIVKRNEIRQLEPELIELDMGETGSTSKAPAPQPVHPARGRKQTTSKHAHAAAVPAPVQSRQITFHFSKFPRHAGPMLEDILRQKPEVGQLRRQSILEAGPSGFALTMVYPADARHLALAVQEDWDRVHQGQCSVLKVSDTQYEFTYETGLK